MNDAGEVRPFSEEASGTAAPSQPTTAGHMETASGIQAAGNGTEPVGEIAAWDIRHDWRIAGAVFITRHFSSALKTPFSTDLLVDALTNPAKFPRFLAQLFTALLGPPTASSENGTARAIAGHDLNWEAVLSSKAADKWSSDFGANPLSSGARPFAKLTLLERVRLLHAACEWRSLSLNQPEASSLGQRLRRDPIGQDADSNQYFFFSPNSEDCWLYREGPRSDPPSSTTWTAVCTSEDQLKQLIDGLQNSDNVHDASLLDALRPILTRLQETAHSRHMADQEALKMEEAVDQQPPPGSEVQEDKKPADAKDSLDQMEEDKPAEVVKHCTEDAKADDAMEEVVKEEVKPDLKEEALKEEVPPPPPSNGEPAAAEAPDAKAPVADGSGPAEAAAAVEQKVEAAAEASKAVEQEGDGPEVDEPNKPVPEPEPTTEPTAPKPEDPAPPHPPVAAEKPPAPPPVPTEPGAAPQASAPPAMRPTSGPAAPPRPADDDAEEEEEYEPPPPVPRRPLLPPPPVHAHGVEHTPGWSPVDSLVPRRKRSAIQVKTTRHLDVLLSCSDGDMPDLLRHRGAAAVFKEVIKRAPAAPRPPQEPSLLARLAQQKQQSAAMAAAGDDDDAAAASRAHGYSTRKRNATRNFKALYPDLMADDEDEGDEDEKLEKVDTDAESSSESGMDSDDSEIGRQRKARRPAPPRPHVSQQQQQARMQQQQKHQQQQMPQRMHAAAQGQGQMHGMAGMSQQQQLQQRLLLQQQQQQGNYGGFSAGANPMQQQAALLQQQQQQQLQQLVQMLSPQEQQMVQMMPAPQRTQALIQLAQQKRLQQAQQQAQQQQRQQVQQQQQQAGQRAGLESMGFVPNGGAGQGGMGGMGGRQGGQGGVPAGMYANLGGMRQAPPPQQQQGMGLQLPGMLGQQQPSINPFTGGGGGNMQQQQQQYRF